MTGPRKHIPRAPTADGIAQTVRHARQRGLPPVEKWDPPDCGDIDMRIAADGRWYYEGSEIRRPEMVRLFSTILRRDADRFVLVTPVEKVGIEVEDAPFIAVDFQASDGGGVPVLSFETNVGDHVEAGPDNPIRVHSGEDGSPRPYIRVRGGLDALIDRKSFYRLADLAEEHAGRIGVWSKGEFFALSPAE